MPIMYNGFLPGERRTSVHQVRLVDKGHSVVETSVTRIGHRFAFRYAVTCQCGKTYTSKESISRAWTAHDKHKEGQ